jgi:hypothetical protein
MLKTTTTETSNRKYWNDIPSFNFDNQLTHVLQDDSNQLLSHTKE